MAVTGGPTIPLTALRGEFGGNTPDAISEYYRATVSSSGFSSQVGAQNTTVPTSGTVDLSDYYNTTKVINLTVSSTVDNYNVFTQAGSPSSNVSVYVSITGSGICRASTTGNYGLSISGFSAGSHIFIRNQGYIVGKGGTGGKYSTGWSVTYNHGPCADGKGGYSNCINRGSVVTAQAGGPAMFIQSGTNIYINNSGGVIGGGGGGGGAGGSNTTGICTASVCCNGPGGEGFGAGGGGAGYGASSTGYSGFCNKPCGTFDGSTASSAGGLTSGGAGSWTSGAGGSLGSAGAAGTSAGTCNAWECDGTCSFTSVWATYSGGAGGAATSGAANATWYVLGTRYGTIG